MPNATKPDALEMLRGLYPHPVPSAFVAEKAAAIAALEAERRDRAEEIYNLREDLREAKNTLNVRYTSEDVRIAVENVETSYAERDAKIRFLLGNVWDALNEKGEGHMDLETVLALLDGGRDA